jgi:hypothetical protein
MTIASTKNDQKPEVTPPVQIQSSSQDDYVEPSEPSGTQPIVEQTSQLSSA